VFDEMNGQNSDGTGPHFHFMECKQGCGH
jgi:hypothetical protein